MTPEERERRIKAGMLAIPARAICWSTTHDELGRLVIDAARLVLEAADAAVPVVTEAHHIAVRGEALKQAAALTAAIRTNLERIIGNELPPSIWAEVDEFFDGLDSKYGKVIPRTRRKTTGQ